MLGRTWNYPQLTVIGNFIRAVRVIHVPYALKRSEEPAWLSRPRRPPTPMDPRGTPCLVEAVIMFRGSPAYSDP